MPNMGRYCKAYPIMNLREFAGWAENTANARPADDDADAKDVSRTITDNDFLYLQENYFVTDGIFIDENIIFDSVTPEWIDFCRNTLAFEVPDYAKDPEINTAQENVAAAHS